MRAIARDTECLNFLSVKQCMKTFGISHACKMSKGQQDSAPCHTSRRTLARLSNNFSDCNTPDMWPPNFPDCNPLHYYIWGEVERETNKTPCNTKDELKAKIMETLWKPSRIKSCRRVRSRSEAVEANCDIIQ